MEKPRETNPLEGLGLVRKHDRWALPKTRLVYAIAEVQQRVCEVPEQCVP